jgi:multiple sugar transport system ATP-binding protein
MYVALNQVSIHFGQVKAVESLSASIGSGELVALLGPSGCGKSTTLFVLVGIYKPTSGEVRFDDKVVNKVDPEDREIGMVFQNYALYPHMSVLDNILFPLHSFNPELLKPKSGVQLLPEYGRTYRLEAGQLL